MFNCLAGKLNAKKDGRADARDFRGWTECTPP